MASSITAQLQAIKASFQGREDPVRRPFTRPSVLFDTKEAADVDLRTILPIAISGLDVLVGVDARFGNYRNTLFSHASLDVDRENMEPKDEAKINKSVASYLRLLSGYLQLPAALKTLEYLIRRYRVHVFNVDDLILCALPYHDTHAFVRIIQLLDLGNGKWRFLDGVKSTGARPPRKMIVQQCIRDKSVLEILCNYASPTREFQHSRVVICFCTAVIVEALGTVHQLDSDTVKRVLPFVFSGLNPAMRGGQDDKAGALMVAGLVASRAAVVPKLLNNLISFIARMVQQDTEELADLPWLRMALMTIVNLVQTQSLQSIPKKALKSLIDIRDFPAVLKGLSEEFNIEKFMFVLLETLIDYSSSDASCCLALATIIETVPMKHFINNIVSKVLSVCLKWSQSVSTTDLFEAGRWIKEILIAIDQTYPSELRAAIAKFLEDYKVNDKEGGDVAKTLCFIVDGNSSLEFSDSNIWFSLEHPKAMVRQTALSHLSLSGPLKERKDTDVQKLLKLQDAILRRLHDDELIVVQAALSIDGLSEIIDPLELLTAFRDVLFRCMELLTTGTANIVSEACEVIISCLECTFMNFNSCEPPCLREVATFFFPFLLLLPKTWRISLKALELAKVLHWPFYSERLALHVVPSFKVKNLEPSIMISINQKTVRALAETFIKNPMGHVQWLIECCSKFKSSKNLLFFIFVQAALIHKEGSDSLLKTFQVCLPVLKQEWQILVADDNSIASEEFSIEKLDKLSNGFISEMFSCDTETMIANSLICALWGLLKALSTLIQRDPLAIDDEWQCVLEDAFLFFVTSSPKHVFKEHIVFLLRKCMISPGQFLSKFYTSEGFSVAVQVQSLVSFSTLCSMSSPTERSYVNISTQVQYLLCFPSLLVPLSDGNKGIRTAAMECIEELYKLMQHLDVSRAKNGNDFWSTCAVSASCFDELLGSITSQKLLVLSDESFLSSFMTSMLSSSQSLVVSQDMEKRFDQRVKDTFLDFILSSGLKMSSYGKLRILTLFKGLGSSMLLVDVVKSLFSELLDRQKQHSIAIVTKSASRLTKVEIEILCLLLEVSFVASSLDCSASVYACQLLEVLKVDGMSLEDPAVVRPCVSILLNMTSYFYDTLETEMQDELFANLVLLFHNDHGEIRNATRGALARINIRSSTIAKFLDVIQFEDLLNASSKKPRRNKQSRFHLFLIDCQISNKDGRTLHFLSSLLDIVLLKKDMEKRESLIEPLIKLLGELLSSKWVQDITSENENQRDALVHSRETLLQSVLYVQQTALHILQDIAASLLVNHSLVDDVFRKFDINLLVKFARTTKDVVTLNHVFMLLSSIAKVSAQWVSEHILELFSIIGDSTARENDSHSQLVLEELISTLIPRWQSTTSNLKDLLQVFIDVLPDVPESRRLALMVYLLRTLGEKESLGVLVALLFHSLVTRKVKLSTDNMDELLPSSLVRKEWEHIFAVQICDQYSCQIWLPSLVVLVQEITFNSGPGAFSEMYLRMQFILQKLQDTELMFVVDSGDNLDHLQRILAEILEKVILQLQNIDNMGRQLSIHRSVRKQLKELMLEVLRSATKRMIPSEFFKAIGQLLTHEDGSVKKEALKLICQNVKGYTITEKRHMVQGKDRQTFSSSLLVHEKVIVALCELSSRIIQLVDEPVDSCPVPIRLAAVSSLELLAQKLPDNSYVSTACLTVVTKHITSDNSTLSSSCLRTAGALISVLGSKALSILPYLIRQILEKAHDVSSCPKAVKARKPDAAANGKASILLSILVVLEEVVEHLGGFLNPYLEGILDLLVLHQEYASTSDQKLKVRAMSLRKLVSRKIHVRLLLSPLIKIYEDALMCSEVGVSLVFEMLAEMVSSLDKPAIGTYHAKIYEHCLLALDLRRQHPETVKNICVIEDHVIHAIIVLTMKLTESMFRPLFLRSLDWAGTQAEGHDTNRVPSRQLSFYRLVNKLTEEHRSLFVSYFKYLLQDCVHHLTAGQELQKGSAAKKRKKSKDVDECIGMLSPDQWHLRALILASLYKCFLYDTGNLKFLDPSNFQVLLKPIVSQLVVEPPPSLEDSSDLPTISEVDESLVCCLGQMAVTVGSDDIWKQLNYEVLMQTRNEKVRPRIVGLRVVKYLVEHLREEYIPCLPETIPFLSELLEDVEPSVKSLSQEILRELESVSGENIQDYLK